MDPIYMEDIDFLRKIKTNKIINYFNDQRFDVYGTEMLKEGPCIRNVLNIKIIYSNNNLSIEYSYEDSFLAFRLFDIIINDSFFEYNLIKIDDKSIIINKKWSTEEFFNNVIEDIKKSNHISIFSNNMCYQKTILHYIVDSNHDSNYYLYKEYEKWGV